MISVKMFVVNVSLTHNQPTVHHRWDRWNRALSEAPIEKPDLGYSIARVIGLQLCVSNPSDDCAPGNGQMIAPRLPGVDGRMAQVLE